MYYSKLFIFLFIIFSCYDPSIQKDCAGISGGMAIIDDCGFCVEGNTGLLYNYIMGCDSICGSGKQIDCEGICGGTHTKDCSGFCYNPSNNELPLKIEDYCGECYNIDDTLSFNSTCSGCRDISACNYDSLAIVHDGSCIFPSLYCNKNEDSFIELYADNVNYYCPEESPDSLFFCGPGTDCCLIDSVYCVENSTYILDCFMDTFNQDTILLCYDYSFIGNDTCNYWENQTFPDDDDLNGTYNASLACSELDYDGGDCSCETLDLYIDCIGRCFGNDWCEDPELGYDGCVEGESTWLGDGSCDNDQQEGGLDLNCILWDFDNGDCSTSLIQNKKTKKLNSKIFYK